MKKQIKKVVLPNTIALLIANGFQETLRNLDQEGFVLKQLKDLIYYVKTEFQN